MTVTSKPIIQAKSAESSQTTQYTVPAGTRAIIDKFTGTNTTMLGAVLTVHLIPSGGSAGDSNKILAKTIAAGECYTCPEVVGHTLNPGDAISTIASSAAAVTIRSTAREVT